MAENNSSISRIRIETAGSEDFIAMRGDFMEQDLYPTDDIEQDWWYLFNSHGNYIAGFATWDGLLIHIDEMD